MTDTIPDEPRAARDNPECGADAAAGGGTFLNAPRRPEVRVAEFAQVTGFSPRRLRVICRRVKDASPTEMFDDIALLDVQAALRGSPHSTPPLTAAEAAAMAGYREPEQLRTRHTEASDTDPFHDERDRACPDPTRSSSKSATSNSAAS